MRRPRGARFARLDVELLAARARGGDRAAARALRTRMTPLARQLALALVGEAWVVPGVVRGALDEAMEDSTGAYAAAVVTAVQRRAVAARAGRRGATARTPEERLAQAVGVLCDGQGHSHRSAAALLGLTAGEVAALHGQGRVALGVDASASRCRGWHLVSGEGLTAPEQAAADGHLALCRDCRDALTARAAARSRLTLALPLGGTALGGIAAAVAGLTQVGASAGGAAALAGATAAVTAAGVVAAPYVAPPVRPAPVAPAAQPSAPVTAPDAAVSAGRPGDPSARRSPRHPGARRPGSVGSPGPADTGLPAAGQVLPGRPDGPAGPGRSDLSAFEFPLPVLPLPGLPTPAGPAPAPPQTELPWEQLPVEREPATGGPVLGNDTSLDAASGVAPPDGDRDGGTADDQAEGGGGDEDHSVSRTEPRRGREGAGRALVPVEVPPVVVTVPRTGPLRGRPTTTAPTAPAIRPSGRPRPRPRPTPGASAPGARPVATASPAPVVRRPVPAVSTTRRPTPAPTACAFPSPTAATPGASPGPARPPSAGLPADPSVGVPPAPSAVPSGPTSGGTPSTGTVVRGLPVQTVRLAGASGAVAKDPRGTDPVVERSALVC